MKTPTITYVCLVFDFPDRLMLLMNLRAWRIDIIAVKFFPTLTGILEWLLKL